MDLHPNLSSRPYFLYSKTGETETKIPASLLSSISRSSVTPELYVRVIRGRDLHVVNGFSGTSDPYVVIQLENEQHRTKVSSFALQRGGRGEGKEIRNLLTSFPSF